MSPRTVQDLGSAFRGLAMAKAPFNCSSGSKGTNTNPPELVPPRSPLEVPHTAVAFLNRGPKGPTMRFAGVWPLVGARATHMVPKAYWAVNHLAVLPLWHNSLATIASPREFVPALTSHCTHHRTSNLPIDGANCKISVFRPGPLQWICREWVQKLGSDEATTCFGGEKCTAPDEPTSQGERTPHLRMWTLNSSRLLGASFFPTFL